MRILHCYGNNKFYGNEKIKSSSKNFLIVNVWRLWWTVGENANGVCNLNIEKLLKALRSKAFYDLLLKCHKIG